MGVLDFLESARKHTAKSFMEALSWNDSFTKPKVKLLGLGEISLELRKHSLKALAKGK